MGWGIYFRNITKPMQNLTFVRKRNISKSERLDMKKVWVLLWDNIVLGAYSKEFKAERAMLKREQEDEAEGKFFHYTIHELEVDEV